MRNDSTTLVVSDISIRRDSEGRYCLNDLHKAAGGDAKHQPALFMRLDSTKALIAELENSTEVQSLTTGIPVVTVEGRNGGTYVVKELVYAYAMWISPAFHLRVIRAYDGIATGNPQPALQKPSMRDQLLFAKQLEKSLKMSESSIIQMYSVLAEENSMPTRMLPSYAYNEDSTAALGTLLQESKSQLSAVGCNPIIAALGYIVQCERKGSKGKIERYWMVTDAGLKYGKNITPPKNPRETQPHWYRKTFSALLDEINAYLARPKSANDESAQEAA